MHLPLSSKRLNCALPLLAVLLTGLFLPSCDDPDTLGLSFQPNELLIGNSYTDTITIETSIIQMDTVKTVNSGRLLLGQYSDGRFGKVTAQAFYQILPNVNFDSTIQALDGEDMIYDSLVFDMQFDYVYGDTLASHNLVFSELSEDISDEREYLNTDFVAVGPELGRIADFVPTKDTLGTRIASIKMDDTFGRRLFDAASTDPSPTLTAFKDEFKGINIKSEPVSGSAVLGISVTSINTVMLLYYHYYDEDGDTINRQYAFGFSSRFNQILSDRTGTALESLADGEISTTLTGQLCHIQAGTGIATRLQFPTLQKWAEGKQIALTKAELFLDPSPDDDYDEVLTPMPSSLYFLLANSDGQPDMDISGGRRILQSESSSSAALSQLNRDTRVYSNPLLTLYLESILSGEEDNNGLIIVPSSEFTSVNSCLLGDLDNTVSKLKLKVYYTEVNQ